MVEESSGPLDKIGKARNVIKPMLDIAVLLAKVHFLLDLNSQKLTRCVACAVESDRKAGGRAVQPSMGGAYTVCIYLSRLLMLL